MSETAVDRVARVLDLVPFALENPGIEVSVLANKFNVSEKQMLADLELIFLCGLPGYTPYELIDLSFEDGVVTVIDPQVLDKPRLFNEIEAVVLHLGLSIMKNAIDDLEKQRIISDLQEKIGAKFSAITDISFTTNKPRFYDLVSDSIKNNCALDLTYTSISRDEVSDRIVLPKSVYLAQGNFYFIALDTQNNQIRHFRMDLIQSCRIATEVPASNSVLADSDEVFDFKIKSRSKYLTERYGDLFTDVTQEGDTYLAEGRMSNSQWLRRLVLSNAPDLELLEPAFLKEEIQDEMQLVLRLYQ
jgi:predicted DNA-binding transcriptional regulator YafY